MKSDFSLYNHIDRKNVRNLFSERPLVLASWCRMIENVVVDFRLAADVYAGFQRMRRLGPVWPRYQKMAGTAQGIWIFGAQDATYPQTNHINFITLTPEDELMREWFLIVDHTTYSRALVARETTPLGTPQQDRLFEGVLIGERAMVKDIKTKLQDTLRT